VNVSYQKLLDRIPYLAWLMSDGGEIVAVNQQWCKYIGQGTGTGERAWLFAEILNAEQQTAWGHSWQAASSSHSALLLKIELPSTQGHWEWFQVELAPDRDEWGQTIWIGTAMRLGGEAVVPGQQSPQADRGSTAQFLDALLTSASDGIVACDAAGQLVLFNLAAQAFHGLPPESIESANWAEFYDLYDRDGTRQLTNLEVPLFRAFQGETVVNQEMMIKSKRGGDRSLLANGTAIYSPTGEKLGAVVLMKDITAYKQAETERLRIQLYNERLSLALRVGKAGAWTWDLQTKQTFWTPELEVLFDYEPGSTEQVYGEWLNRVHPDDLDRVKAMLQQVIDGTLSEYHCEYRILLRNGDIRWIDVIGELHPDEQGQPRSISGLVYDITDRKQDEEALRQSEEFTRRILESNQDCIKVLDLEGRLLYMNDGGQLLMEIDNFDTVANTQWVGFWSNRETQAAINALATANAGGNANFEGYCNTFKGMQKCWDVAVTPILDAKGNVERILAVSRDITKRKQAEIDLQASEELFRHVFERTPLGFAHVGMDGSLLRVNHKFCEIVGYSEAELLTKTFQSITEPADLAADLAAVAQLVNGEIAEYTLEKRYIHKQGHSVWVSLTVVLIRSVAISGQTGTPEYFLGAIKDINDRKRGELLIQTQTADLQRLNNSLMLAQQKLQERNVELDRFVSIAAHDLKAPLRAIANLSEWIEEDLQAQIPGENSQLQLLRQRVKRMDALIDGLLRYSRAGRAELATETVDVADVLVETIDSLSPPASFELKIVNPMPILNTKRLLLTQVFANLISNAIKHHNRADGQIEITAEDLGDRHQFSIADDGPGIPEGESQSRIFEIFQTLNPATDSTENTGIGLALVKKIVEGEGGEIWLDLEYKLGCRFCFTWMKTTMPSQHRY
jgi:PAS domain S-box-containing protein